MSWGKAVGASAACAQFRDCCCRIDGDASDPHVLDAAVRILQQYRDDGLRITEVCRQQEPICPHDVIHLHAYLIFKMSNSHGSQKTLQVRYLRLDFGAKGIWIQESDSASNFCAYTKKSLDVAIENYAMATVAAAGASGVAVTLGCVTTSLSLLGVGMAFAGVVVYSLASSGSIQPEELPFTPVQWEADAISNLISILRQRQGDEYDIRSWNCNHFADYVCSGLQGDLPICLGQT